MAYVVLARKYRPQTFAELVGQAPIVRTLRNAMAMDRVHHAFLFTGARGTGKTTTARLLARALNCQDGPTMQPCGQCPSCRDVAQGSSASVIEIDGASNTGVDSVRELREGARYVPAQGRFKIYIVDEVHMLSQAAFNALLKVLEEPPAHVKFIFATTEPHKIPATILSRCQRFDFRRLDAATLAAHLGDVLRREGLQLGEAALHVIARQAGGSVRDALSLLDQVLSYAGDDADFAAVQQALGAVDARLLFALTDAVVHRQPEALLALVADIEREGHDLGQIVQLFLAHLRDVAVAKSGAGAAGLPHRSAEELAELRQQAEARSHGDWQRLFDKACEVAGAMRHAAAEKIVFEMGLLRLMHVAPAADVADLLQRLDNLVAALPQGGEGEGGAAGPGGPASPRGGSGGGQGPAGAPGATGGGAQPTGITKTAGAAPAHQATASAPASAPAAEPPPEPVTATPEAHPSSAFVTSPTLSRAPELMGAARDCGKAPASGRPAAGPGPAATSASPASPEADATASAPPAAGAGPAPRAASAGSDANAANDAAGGQGAADAHGAGDLTCQFRAFVDNVRRARPSLASVLEHGQLVHFSAAEVVVAFVPQTFWWDAVTDADNRALFERLLQTQLQAKVGWRVVALDHAATARPSLAEERQTKATTAWERTKAQAGEHAAVRAAQQILGSTLQDIVPATTNED